MYNNKRILVAGASGYLGRHIIDALKNSNTDYVALARHTVKLKKNGVTDTHIRVADVTNPSSLIGCCDGINVVISCVGITRQKDGLKYMDVDYQANCHLLEEAIKAGVKKFIYISAFNAPLHNHVRLLHAKEKFADKLLKTKQLTPCVIRSNGFFSDLEEYYRMAQSGRAYVFGDGRTQLNPIHGTDLAHFCLEAINMSERELSVGGPETLSLAQIAMLAFEAQGRADKAEIINLPDWMRRTALLVAKLLPERFGGPTEFFLTVSAKDMVAPLYGTRTLGEHFRSIYQLNKQ